MTRFAVLGWSEGKSPGANQDAFRFVSSKKSGRQRLDVAVADGSTGSLFAGPWAEALVVSAIDGWAGLADAEIVHALETLRTRFDPLPEGGLDDRFRSRKWQELGSQATLLCASLDDVGSGGEVRAVAVGDCDLLCVHHQEVVGFPIPRSGDFTNRPELVTSRPDDGVALEKWARALERDDILIFATDAVAHHLLELAESLGSMEVLVRLRSLLEHTENPGALTTALLGCDGGRFDDDATLVLCGVTSEPGGEDRLVLESLLDRLLGREQEPWLERAARLVRRLAAWRRLPPP